MAKRLRRSPRRRADPKLELDAQNEVRKLRQMLRKAQDVYYNSGQTIMSDETYDRYERRLQRLSPGDKLLKRIETTDTRAARKTRLPYPMPSLDKPKFGKAFDKWLADHPGPYVVSDKLDGVSASLVGNDAMYTRGTSGVVGSDISHMRKLVRGAGNLPRGIKAVRGELVLTRDTFTRKYADEFENSRNLTSGAVNSVNRIHPATKDLVLLVHSQLEPQRSLAQSGPALKAAGFNVVPFSKHADLDEAKLLEILGQRREKSRVDIDGLVVTASDGAIAAFKAGYIVAQVVVEEVVWKDSRYGYLKPTIIVKDGVRLAGATIRRVTAHNAKTIIDGGVGPGAVIEITRQGDVIPKLLRVVKASKQRVEPRGFGTKYIWNKTGVDLVAVGNKSDGAKVQELVIFLVRLGVDKVKEGVVAKLVESGIDTIPDLVHASMADLTDADIGNAIASHLHARLRAGLKLVDVATLAGASNVMPRGMGEMRIRAFLSAVDFKQQLQLYKADRKGLIDRLAGVPGVGLRTATEYVAALPAFARFLRDIRWKPMKRTPKRHRRTKLGPAPKVAFTGFRDAELQRKITALGGSVSGVSRNTTHLVIPSKGFASEKTRKADSYGVKIYTIAQFQKLMR